MRRVALAIVTVIAWLPGLVQALGLGGIEISSYLNQPLDAKIRLLSSAGEDLTDLRVALASRASFEKVGIEFTHILRSLRFSVETGKKGESYIKVTTHKRLRDPFLNFLVEVNWSRGRIQREYTLLIDPPTFTKAAPQPTRAPVAARPATRPVQTPSGSAPRRSAAPQPSYSGDTYHTGRNDTLWKIAQDVRPSADVSTEQMMLALLNENPNAFIGQNINRLKAGHTLNIPGYDSITGMSQREARAEVSRQYRDWKQGRIGSGQAAPAAAGESGRLELLASDDAGVSAGGQTGAAGDQASGATTKDLSLAREAAEASRQENAELRSRIATLEQQIENVTRIASLKDEQLAALQKTLAELRAQDTTAAAEAPETEMPAPAEPEVAEPEAAEQPAEPEAAPEPVAERPDYGPQVEAKPAAPGTPVNQHVVEGYQPIDINALPKSELPAQPFRTPAGAPAETEDAAPVQEPALTSYTDEMMAYIEEQPLVASIVAVVLGFIVIVVIVTMVRKRSAGDDFQESILTDGGEVSMPVSDETAVDLQDTLSVEETQTDSELTDLDMSGVSQMSGFDISSIETVDAESAAAEADPLTEADVLMAYGRFQPAEVMIQEAIEQEPDRKDLRFKLLEIYHAARNQDDFEREASTFQNYLDGDADPLWEKVSDMGHELCPDSALFGGAAPSVQKDQVLDGLEQTVLDMEPLTDKEEEALEAEDDLRTDTGSAEPAEDLDFDLTSYEGEGTASGDMDETIIADADEAELDLDLGGTTATAAAHEADKYDESDKMASDLAAELEDIAGTMTTSEFDLDNVAADEELSGEFDLGGALEPTVEVHSEDILDAGVSELDEVTTKLDLAKAYIDMGDPDGARSILEEVMEEGNDEQKNDAQGLLDQI